MALELIDSDFERDEKGWNETTTLKSYYLNRETGEVTYVETVSSDNMYRPHKSFDNKETERRILSPNQIPPHIRLKIRGLMKVTK